jgi:hypothetical protein
LVSFSMTGRARGAEMNGVEEEEDAMIDVF